MQEQSSSSDNLPGSCSGDASDAVSDAVSNQGSDYASDMEAELIGEGNEAEGAEEMEDIDDVAQPTYSQQWILINLKIK